MCKVQRSKGEVIMPGARSIWFQAALASVLLALSASALSVPAAQTKSSASSLNRAMGVTWSNRLGVTLTPIATGVWAAERPFVWNSIDVGGRSVICRAGDGTLLVHSPVEWTSDLGSCLDALGGGVGHVVSPNYEHLKYVRQWREKYPEAQMLACPGLRERMPDVPWSAELGVDPAPNGFDGAIECVHFDCEINPFTRKPFFNEVVFFHIKSKSLIVTDTYWNYPASSLPNYFSEQGTGNVHVCPKMPVDNESDALPSVDVPLGTKLWKFGMDKVYLPFYKNFMVGGEGSERRDKYKRAVEKVLQWEPELIVPCHGDVIRGKELCRKVLTEHFY